MITTPSLTPLETYSMLVLVSLGSINLKMLSLVKPSVKRL